MRDNLVLIGEGLSFVRVAPYIPPDVQLECLFVGVQWCEVRLRCPQAS